MNGSRLVVLVEDTTATRDLWPLWRRQALEPILTKIESAALGPYELNLVAFSSVDGQCDGLLRSGAWTRSVEVFRGYCERLTFEGSGGNGLSEALNEASYLAGRPGQLTTGVQHVMLCATQSMGRLPVTWPFREGRDVRMHALTILSGMITTLGVTVSIVTERNAHGVLSKRFGTLVGERTLKKCEELSEGMECLVLLHPGWRHGYEAVFPEFKEVDEWAETPRTHSFTDSDHGEMFASVMDGLDDVTDSERPMHARLPEISPYQSFRKGQSFPDAVELDAWHRAKESTSRNWKEDDIQEAEGCSYEVEFGLEKGLLGLEDQAETERDVCSEKESKIESCASHGMHSPALSSTRATRDRDQPGETSERMDPFQNAAVRLAAPDDGSSSSHTHRATFEPQGSKTLSSSASVSVEEGTGRKIEHKRTPEPSPISMDTPQESRQHSDNFNNHAAWQQTHAPSQRTTNMPNNYAHIDGHVPPYYQGMEQDMHEAKRLRTSYGRNGGSPLIKLPASTYSPHERDVSTRFMHTARQDPRGQQAVRQPARLPPRTLMPSSGFGWNVEWSGPLYLAGPIVRQSEPQKLFDLEILCKRTLSNYRMWPNELVVHSMARREHQRCPVSCMINIKFESLTEMGRAFGKWLTENNMLAIVDLLGEKSSRLIMFVQDSNNYGQCQLVAGFQRDWVQRL